MEIYHDGVPVYELPEYAVCKADEKKRNPLYMDVCPMGYEDCVDGCEEYDEEWQESEDNIMMDAVKYLKERERMCDSYNHMCDGCGFGKVPKCNSTEKDNPEKAVEIVEKWSSEHPAKTRQSEILKIIPDATIRNGILITKPCEVNEKIKDRCKKYDYCRDCRKEYWLAEIK